MTSIIKHGVGGCFVLCFVCALFVDFYCSVFSLLFLVSFFHTEYDSQMSNSMTSMIAQKWQPVLTQANQNCHIAMRRPAGRAKRAFRHLLDPFVIMTTTKTTGGPQVKKKITTTTGPTGGDTEVLPQVPGLIYI